MAWWDRLLGNSPNDNQTSGSRQIARERLQLALLNDRFQLSSEILTQIQADFVAVVSRYGEVDRHGINISCQRNGRQDCVVAKIPVVRFKRRD